MNDTNSHRTTDGPDEGPAKRIADEARETFEDVKREGATQARKTSDHVRRTAENSAEAGASRLASQVGSVSKAIHRSGESFREDGQDLLAEQADRSRRERILPRSRRRHSG